MTTTAPTQPQHHRVRSVATAVFSTRTAANNADVGLIVVRLVLAWVFIYYGAGKLFSAFNGPGIHRFSLYMSQVAHLHPGGLFAVSSALIEFFGGVAIAIGFCARLAGLALVVDMVMAMITVTWATGIAATMPPPGYQLNLTLAALAVVMIVFGAGRLSIDALIERQLVGSAAPPTG